MSSTPLRNRRFPFMPVRAGRSTAQAALAKIINIIVTVPPPRLMDISLFGSGAYFDAKEISTMPTKEAVNLDLRLGLSLQTSQEPVAFAPATGVDDQNSTAHSGVFDSDGAYTVDKIPKKKPIPFNDISQVDFSYVDFSVSDKSAEGECFPGAKPIVRRSTKISEVTSSSWKDEDVGGGKSEASVKEGEGYNCEGYLSLLLDAALLVSSEGRKHEGDAVYEKSSARTPSLPPLTSNTVRRKRGSSCEMHRSKKARTSSTATIGFKEYENTEPITCSKRGRPLVIPSRYRDSILEPWRKAPTLQRR